MLAGGECDDPHRFAGRDTARHRCDARDRTGPACRVERDGGAADRAGAARAASAGTGTPSGAARAGRACLRALAFRSCAAAIPGRSGRGGGSCWASGSAARGRWRCAARWGRNGTIWGYPIHVSWRRTLRSLTATARCIACRCAVARPACASREAEQSWKPCSAAGAAQERLLLETAALCRAAWHGAGRAGGL